MTRFAFRLCLGMITLVSATYIIILFIMVINFISYLYNKPETWGKIGLILFALIATWSIGRLAEHFLVKKFVVLSKNSTKGGKR